MKRADYWKERYEILHGEVEALRRELRHWHSAANEFANRRNRAEISAADLRESIADLEEAHGGALIAQAAAVRMAEEAEEQFRKAAEWNKLTNLEIENLRSLNAGLEEDAGLIEWANRERVTITWNPHHDAFIVQRYDQVCGNIGVGKTIIEALRAAIDSAQRQEGV